MGNISSCIERYNYEKYLFNLGNALRKVEYIKVCGYGC